MNNYQDGIYLLTPDQIQTFLQGRTINLSNNQIIRPHNSAQEPLLNNQQNQSPQNYQNPVAAGNQQQFGNQGSFVIQPGYQQQNPMQNQYQNSSQNPQQQPPQIPHQNQFQNPSQNQFQNQPQISQQNLAQHPSQNPQQYPPLNQAQNPQNQQNPYQNNQYYVPQSQINQNLHQGHPLDPNSQQINQQPYGSKSGQVVPQGYQGPVVLVISSFQQGYNQYLETVPKLLGSYLTFTIACICLQLITCGAKSAAGLWIANFILLSIAMALIRFTFIYQRSFLLYIHFFLMVVQFILEVPAFAIAVSHPPILFVDAEVFGVDIVLTQEAGSCQIFSDQAEVPSEWLKYWNGLQYANLIVCLIQFIQSFFVMYHVLRRGWNFFQFTRNQNPQPQPQPQ